MNIKKKSKIGKKKTWENLEVVASSGHYFERNFRTIIYNTALILKKKHITKI